MAKNDDLLIDANLTAHKQVGLPTLRRMRRLGKVVFTILCFVIPGVVFLPWLQTTSGSGRVIAFDPLDRRAVIQAQVSGRVGKLLVAEGQRITRGQLIAELEPNDPELLNRLRAQLAALNQNLYVNEARVADLEDKRDRKQNSMKQAIEAEENKIRSAEAELEFRENDFIRKETLFKEGAVAQVELQRAKADHLAALNKLAESRASREKVENSMQSEIADIRASINSTRGTIASLERQIAQAESDIASNSRLAVTAPRDGIVSAVSTNDGEFLSPGTPICTVIPETDERFAEVTISGNYVPLINARKTAPDGTIERKGSLVRLQFEGWPAIQFAGWPSVAVGTFGGEVIFIDEQDDGFGNFRIIVAPEDIEPDKRGRLDEEWPNPRWLRQGARVKAWVQIQQVPLWNELWRRFNGFPPALPDEAPADIKNFKPRKPKL